jgi:hypothetical protein
VVDKSARLAKTSQPNNQFILMKKIVISNAGQQALIFSCPLGRNFSIAASGATTLALAAWYSTAAGVYTQILPTVALTANGMVTGTNVGFNTDIKVDVTVFTGGPCTIIFNVLNSN